MLERSDNTYTAPDGTVALVPWRYQEPCHSGG